MAKVTVRFNPDLITPGAKRRKTDTQNTGQKAFATAQVMLQKGTGRGITFDTTTPFLIKPPHLSPQGLAKAGIEAVEISRGAPTDAQTAAALAKAFQVVVTAKDPAVATRALELAEAKGELSGITVTGLPKMAPPAPTRRTATPVPVSATRTERPVQQEEPAPQKVSGPEITKRQAVVTFIGMILTPLSSIGLAANIFLGISALWYALPVTLAVGGVLLAGGVASINKYNANLEGKGIIRINPQYIARGKTSDTLRQDIIGLGFGSGIPARKGHFFEATIPFSAAEFKGQKALEKAFLDAYQAITVQFKIFPNNPKVVIVEATIDTSGGSRIHGEIAAFHRL
ncbi:MAG: hypothetical protein ABIE84_00380 [bacterium]